VEEGLDPLEAILRYARSCNLFQKLAFIQVRPGGE
jgi:hypothetical protein